MSAVVDFPVKPEARPYLDAFEELSHGAYFGEDERLAKIRRLNMNRFAASGFPTRRSENWRYLDLHSITGRPMLPIVTGPLREPRVVAALPGLAMDGAGSRVVLIDGKFADDLSIIDLPEGAWLGSMIDAVTERPDMLGFPATDTDAEKHPLATLNAAFFSDGYALHTGPGIVLETPIEVIHLISAGVDDGSVHTRNFIDLGEHSSATIIENYVDIHKGQWRNWRNDVCTVRLAKGATLTRTVLVEEAADAVHFAQIEATLGANAKLDAFALLLGGGTVRHETSVTLAGDGAACHIDGAFVVSGREEANIVTTIDHAAVGGTTSELIKGVAAGRGHGAFQGKIIVREGAQQTDARQTSRNLILGRRAVIDTKPELEILADDVKCAHGASVGDLDEAALFYLRARGIPTEEARRLLVEGFLREPIEGIADPAIRDHLLRRLSLRLARLESE